MKFPTVPNIDDVAQAAYRLKKIKLGAVVDETMLRNLNRAANHLNGYRKQSLEIAELQRLWHNPDPVTFDSNLQKALSIYNYYGNDALTVSLHAASIRSGTPHAEGFQNARPWCTICGYCDDGLPDPIFHPEFYWGRIAS